ncbi:MAG: hypothetical protein ACXW3C_04355 [Pyrinomonadaceae bacterium]
MNSRNQSEFNLQHAGIEAIVERRNFYLEGSPTPRFQIKVYYDGDKPFGDTFLYQGHQYPAKQPGQFMAGAIAYFVLHLFGLDYSRHYLLTAALVSFFTTSLVTALAAVAVFKTVRELIGEEGVFWALVSALVYGLGTTAFAYAGFAYHDALASGYLAIAFYFAVLLARRPRERSEKLLAASCGLLLGLTVTTSMLPFFMACVVALYVVSLRRWNLIVPLMLGGLIGISPLLFYNSVSFGNPFLNSYTVGGYPESDLHLNLHNSIDKVRLYLSEISLYVPVAWLGVVSLLFFPRTLRREQLALLGLLLALALQVLNIDSHGGCHYGPRFLLPAMPFMCLGLGGFVYLRSKVLKPLAMAGTIVLGVISFLINAAGATYTAMYCDTNQYALWPALQNMRVLNLKDFPLAIWLGLPLLLSVVLLVYSIQNYQPSNSGSFAR